MTLDLALCPLLGLMFFTITGAGMANSIGTQEYDWPLALKRSVVEHETHPRNNLKVRAPPFQVDSPWQIYWHEFDFGLLPMQAAAAMLEYLFQETAKYARIASAEPGSDL